MAKKKVKTAKVPILNQKQQHDDMVSRYGWNVNYVDVEMYLTFTEMVEYFGEMCEEYEPLCACCSNWLSWHKTGKATISFERDELLKILKGK